LKKPLVLVLGFLWFSFLFFLPGIVAGQDSVGEVVALEGVVKIFPGGGTMEKALTKGAPVFVKDRIKTEKGKVKILLRDESLIALGERTDLILTEHQFSDLQGKRVVKLDLMTGKVRALIGRYFPSSDSKFEVVSPTSVTGVRGSHFIVQVLGADGQTVVLALSGEISVSGLTAEALGQAILTAGMKSFVGAGGAPGKPEPVTAEEIKQQMEGTDIQMPAWLANLGDLLKAAFPGGTQGFTLVVTEVPDSQDSPGQGNSEAWRALVNMEVEKRKTGDVVVHY